MESSAQMGSGRDERRGGARRTWWRLAVAVVTIVAGVVTAWRLGAFDLLSVEQVDRIDAWFASLGVWAPLVFILLWIVACIFFLPGLPISIAGGLIFGAVWGTVYTTIGANLGAAAAFLIARSAARGLVERRIRGSSALRRIDDGVARHGWRMLMVTRLVPLFPFNVQNYVYGLTDIRFGTYVLVNVICMLPGTMAYNFAAGAVRTGNFSRTLAYLGAAAVLFVLLSLIPGWLRRRYGGALAGEDAAEADARPSGEPSRD